VRDRRGTEAVIGDRVCYITTDGTRRTQIHEARVEGIDQTQVLVRSAGLRVTAAAWSEAAT